MVRCNGEESLILKELRISGGERGPGLHLDVLAFHIETFGLSLVEGMALYEIDGRLDFIPEEEISQLVWREIIDTNGSDFPFGIELFEGTPSSIVVMVWLVDQVEIEVVKSQVLHRAGKASFRPLVAGVSDP